MSEEDMPLHNRIANALREMESDGHAVRVPLHILGDWANHAERMYESRAAFRRSLESLLEAWPSLATKE